jgi:EmrB/QacA subfamily drug resistance transporter
VTELEVDSVADAPPAVEPHPRRFLVFAIVSMGLFLVAVDQTIVGTALGTLGRDLHAKVNWSGWTITVYSLGQVIIMPVAGKISDQFGRRRVFLIAIALFTGASLACGLADNIYLLVVLRGLQALGGGALMPSATGIVADEFGPSRDRAVGFFTSIFPIGGVVGPILGGVFVTYWSWRGIFLVNVPIGIVLFTLGALFVPDGRRVRSGPLDLRGIALLAATLLAAMFGIAYLGGGGVSAASPLFIVPEVAAVLGAIVFVRHARVAPSPFISIELLRGHGFGVMNLINYCYGMAALGLGAIVPLYAQNRYHIATLPAGTLLTARAVGILALGGIAALAIRRTGYRAPMIGGYLLMAIGLLMMWHAPVGLSPYAWLAVGAAVTGVGMGASVPAANNATLHLAPEQTAGIAGLRGMFRQLGAITAVSVTTAIVASSSDPGLAQGRIFAGFAVVLVLVTPAVLLVPEHRGSW